MIHGNPGFFVKEIVAVLAVSAYAFLFSWIMLWLINRFVRVRTTESEESEGLDITLHGERAYI